MRPETWFRPDSFGTSPGRSSGMKMEEISPLAPQNPPNQGPVLKKVESPARKKIAFQEKNINRPPQPCLQVFGSFFLGRTHPGETHAGERTHTRRSLRLLGDDWTHLFPKPKDTSKAEGAGSIMGRHRRRGAKLVLPRL